MAILHRFGSADEFDPSKMQARELAYVNTTNKYYKAGLYLCYAPGDVRRQTTEQDIINILNSNESAYTALQQLLTDLESNPSELTNILNNILALQTDKLDKVGDSKDNITTFTEFATDTDVASGEKHETLFSKLLKNIKTLRSGKIDKTSIGQTDTVNDVTKVASTAITYAHGQSISTINNNLAKRMELINISASTSIDNLKANTITTGAYSWFTGNMPPTSATSQSISVITVGITGGWSAQFYFDVWSNTLYHRTRRYTASWEWMAWKTVTSA